MMLSSEMRKKKRTNIQESQVEEALVSNLLYLKKLLKLTHELRLLARQLRLKSGEQRLDLLIAHGKELCLIELKVTKFLREYIDQINEYRKELHNLQESKELVEGEIRAFLLVTVFTQRERKLCESQNIQIIVYEPLDVLQNYFQNLSTVVPFLKIKPNDYGVFNIGLINRALNKLSEEILTESELAARTKLSKGSIHNHLRVANEFGLARKRGRQWSLTDLGDKYIASKKEGALIDILTDEQSEILKKFIAENPFYSHTVFGIYSIVESAFILSRNSYPINLDELRKTFVTVGGKKFEWQAPKSQSTATYSFLNFAIDLGLLGKIGKQVVITPMGFRFILMLQLHKSIEMVESLSSEQLEEEVS